MAAELAGSEKASESRHLTFTSTREDRLWDHASTPELFQLGLCSTHSCISPHFALHETSNSSLLPVPVDVVVLIFVTFPQCAQTC